MISWVVHYPNHQDDGLVAALVAINKTILLLSMGHNTYLTHWGRVTHICVGKLTIIGSDNALSPGRRQAIIWTNAGLLSIGPLRTYFSENLIKIQQFSLKKMHVKMSSAKCRPSCLGLNVLMYHLLTTAQLQPYKWHYASMRAMMILACTAINRQYHYHHYAANKSWTRHMDITLRMAKGFIRVCRHNSFTQYSFWWNVLTLNLLLLNKNDPIFL